jgi:hypothetical protein
MLLAVRSSLRFSASIAASLSRSVGVASREAPFA